MKIWWVYEVFNMLGISDGLYAAFTNSSEEAEKRIYNCAEYCVSAVRFIEATVEPDFMVMLV